MNRLLLETSQPSEAGLGVLPRPPSPGESWWCGRLLRALGLRVSHSRG